MMRIARIVGAVSAGAFLFGAIGTEAARPHDPFIFRAVMREKPRMIMIALHSGLSVVYDAQTCGLYQAWKGGMQDGNATYHHQTGGNRGATYYPKGKIAYWQKPGGEVGEDPPADNRETSFSPRNEALVPVWTASKAEVSLAVKTDYRGYAVNNPTETATLRYGLILPDGARIEVEETPEYLAVSGGAGLQRDFSIKGVPAGVSVALQLTGNPIKKADGSLVADGWAVVSGAGKVEKRGGKDFLVLGADGQTRITSGWR